MISDLNEKCLLKFLSKSTDKDFGKESNMVTLLNQFGIDVKFHNSQQLYDIIDEYENN